MTCYNFFFIFVKIYCLNLLNLNTWTLEYESADVNCDISLKQKKNNKHLFSISFEWTVEYFDEMGKKISKKRT